MEGKMLPFDGCGRCPNPISLPTTFIAENAEQLDTLIPEIVRSFGADGVHLVAHSKGGLDTRAYLATYQPAHDDQFKVLSFTSLSTPHNGSLLADLKQETFSRSRAGRHEFVDFPGAIDVALEHMGGEPDRGQQNMTTGFMAAFNAGNLANLPKRTIYNAIAGDMDLDGDGMITMQAEYIALLKETSTLTRVFNRFGSLPRTIINTLYQVLRHVRSFEVEYATDPTFTRVVVIFFALPQPVELGNDSLVTLPSGLGEATFASRVINSHVFQGDDGRNHASIADAGVAVRVLPWLFDIEKEHGDLRPFWQSGEHP
jgi:triacylglycerol esterase/lipase EstA (alpha/beta hydrolase family)